MARCVADLMHRGVLTCTQTTPLQEVARRMTENDVSSLVVLDQQGSMAGIVSRTDIVNARVYEQFWRDWRSLTAGHIMTRDVVTVEAGTSLPEAGRLMMERRIHRLVVIEQRDGRREPIGMLSLTDIVRDLAQGNEGK